MKSIIRLPGIAAFVIFTALLIAISVLFVDSWIKLALESSAGKAVGAEVNIGSVEHRFSPFGVTVSDIQITDAQAPTRNKVRISKASADVEFLPLLMNKVIVDQLVIDGVQFDQPRDSEGEVYRHEDQSIIETALPDNIQAPSIEEILANSPLKTTHAAEQTRATYQQHEQAVKQAYDQLPDKETLEQYKQRIKLLQDTDYKDLEALAKARDQFDAIKKDLKAEKAKVEYFKATVMEAKQDLGPKLAELKDAPRQDYDLLKGLVAGDAAAFADVTESVFGPQARQWSEHLFAAYDLVAPMLASQAEESEKIEREEGKWITFDDQTALPSVLIKTAKVSIEWQQQSIVSNWQNITNEHDILGTPTTFQVSSEKSPLWQNLAIEGDLWLAADGVTANQTWDLKGVLLEQLNLSDNKLISTLQKALLSSQGTLNITKDRLDGSGLIDLAELEVQASGDNKLTSLIANALQQLSTLQINIDISGLLNSPSFSFDSDLDQQLGRMLTDNLDQEAKQKLARLQDSLDEKGASALNLGNDGMQQWLKWEALADGDLSSIENLMSSQLNNIIDKKKEALKDKLKSKLFGN